MRKLLHVLAAAFFLLTATWAPARAELSLPPDVMHHATVGINGVYNLDYDTAQEHIAWVFLLYAFFLVYFLLYFYNNIKLVERKGV